jgi:hypothetical protein
MATKEHIEHMDKMVVTAFDVAGGSALIAVAAADFTTKLGRARMPPTAA